MAALLREIEHLSVEGRRVLLACAYLTEASVTELKRVTGYDDARMTACIAELQSLFLLGAPALLRKEPRFRVSDNTAVLIVEKRNSLLTDPAALLKRVELVRTESVSGAHQVVGAAIRQASAMLGEKRYEDAIATVQSALERKPGHPDLLYTLGRCQWAAWKERQEPSLDRVRKTWRRAYDAGQRRDVLFEEWHQAEQESKDFNGAREVCQLALNSRAGDPVRWHLRLAQAHYDLALVHVRTLDLSDGLRELNASVQQLLSARARTPGMLQDRIDAFLCTVNDERYRIASVSREFPDLIAAYDVVKEILGSGDVREVNYLRLIDVVSRFGRLLSHRDFLSRGNINQMERMLREARSEIEHSDSIARAELLGQLRDVRHEIDTVRLDQ